MNHNLISTQLIHKRKKYNGRKNYFASSGRHQKRIKEEYDNYQVSCDKYLQAIGLQRHHVTLIPLQETKEFKIEVLKSNTSVENYRINVLKHLHIKDITNLSDSDYNTQRENLHPEDPPLSQIIVARKEINEKIKVYQTKKGVYVCIRQKVEYVMKRILKNHALDTNILNIKYAGDSVNAGKLGSGKKILHITFSVLEEKDKNITASGTYTIGLFDIEKECYDEVKESLQEIKEEMRNFNEISIEDKIYKIVPFMTGDYKFLQIVLGMKSANSKFPCIGCKYRATDDYTELDSFEREWSMINRELGARTIDEAILYANSKNKNKKKQNETNEEEGARLNWGYNGEPIFDFIPVKNHIFDILHLFLRISDRLTDLLEYTCMECDSDNSEKPNYKRLLEFLVSDCNIKNPTYEKNNETHLRDFTGNVKMKIFENLDIFKVLPEEPRAEKIQKIWKDFNDILYLVKDNKLSAFEIKKRTKSWLNLYLSIYPAKEVTPYIHLFVYHLHELQELYGDINSFNQQGLENLNGTIKAEYFKATNKKSTDLLQLMNKQNRYEILSLELYDVLIKPEKSHDTFEY